VVARLLGRKLRDGWQDAERVAGEHDNVARLALDHARNLRVGDVLDRIRAARVLGDRYVFVVGLARDWVVHDVFEDGPEADGVKDFWLLLARETDALGVAAALDVEDARVGPDVLVVADQQPAWIGRKRRLARAGKTEEECDVAILDAYVRRRVEGELSKSDRLEVVLHGESHVTLVTSRVEDTVKTDHDGEDALLHLPGVLCTKDNHLHSLKVDLDRRRRTHPLGEAVGRELAGVVNDEIGLAKVLELLFRWADEHVVLWHIDVSPKHG
jgi:hypothetical protein